MRQSGSRWLLVQISLFGYKITFFLKVNFGISPVLSVLLHFFISVQQILKLAVHWVGLHEYCGFVNPDPNLSMISCYQ